MLYPIGHSNGGLECNIWIRNVVLPALKSFQFHYNNLAIPQEFSVPADASWPTITHNLRLGQVAKDLYHGAYNETIARDLREELVAMGFVGMSLWSTTQAPLPTGFDAHVTLPVLQHVPPPAVSPNERLDFMPSKRALDEAPAPRMVRSRSEPNPFEPLLYADILKADSTMSPFHVSAQEECPPILL